ncbi:hypothetical protein FACS1894152_1860 [Bacilli bacterium]|nr:hypothetical protein FACS1894152_1860 [Bacilli bacterium]
MGETERYMVVDTTELEKVLLNGDIRSILDDDRNKWSEELSDKINKFTGELKGYTNKYKKEMEKLNDKYGQSKTETVEDELKRMALIHQATLFQPFIILNDIIKEKNGNNNAKELKKLQEDYLRTNNNTKLLAGLTHAASQASSKLTKTKIPGFAYLSGATGRLLMTGDQEHINKAHYSLLKPGTVKRPAATHGAEMKEGQIVEVKSVHLKGNRGKNIGMGMWNDEVGREGHRCRITDDGRTGHLYLYKRTVDSKNKKTAILFGFESCEPPSPYKFWQKSEGAFGDHSISATKNKTTGSGGKKADEIVLMQLYKIFGEKIPSKANKEMIQAFIGLLAKKITKERTIVPNKSLLDIIKKDEEFLNTIDKKVSDGGEQFKKFINGIPDGEFESTFEQVFILPIGLNSASVAVDEKLANEIAEFGEDKSLNPFNKFSATSLSKRTEGELEEQAEMSPATPTSLPEASSISATTTVLGGATKEGLWVNKVATTKSSSTSISSETKSLDSSKKQSGIYK